MDKLKSDYLDLLSECYKVDLSSGEAMLHDVDLIISKCLAECVLTGQSFDYAKKIISKSVVDMTNNGVNIDECDALLNYATKRIQNLI